MGGEFGGGAERFIAPSNEEGIKAARKERPVPIRPKEN